jgi:hypothetical protein
MVNFCSPPTLPSTSSTVSTSISVLGQQTSAMAQLYVATRDNTSFVGGGAMASMASQMALAIGPSGRNTEYVFQFGAALRQLARLHLSSNQPATAHTDEYTVWFGEDTKHVNELESAIAQYLKSNPVDPSAVAPVPLPEDQAIEDLKVYHFIRLSHKC